MTKQPAFEGQVVRNAIVLGVATFLVYLTFGLFYVTGPMSPFKGINLQINGDRFIQAYPGWDTTQEFDDAAYNRAALEILHTGIPRDRTGSLFLHAPIYAYFVAGCYWIAGFRLLA